MNEDIQKNVPLFRSEILFIKVIRSSSLVRFLVEIFLDYISN